MNHKRSGIVACLPLALVFWTAANCHADIITFGTSGLNASLPYTETGFQLSTVSGNNLVIPNLANPDRLLNLGVAVTGQPSSVVLTATNGGPFNLASLQLIRPVSFAWTIQGSNGSSVNLNSGLGPGTLNFTALGDWTNLTSVNFIHTAGALNANMQIDNIVVNAVPEPSGLALTALAFSYIARRTVRKQSLFRQLA